MHECETEKKNEIIRLFRSKIFRPVDNDILYYYDAS